MVSKIAKQAEVGGEEGREGGSEEARERGREGGRERGSEGAREGGSELQLLPCYVGENWRG